jgi:hypothetical protein
MHQGPDVHFSDGRHPGSPDVGPVIPDLGSGCFGPWPAQVPCPTSQTVQVMTVIPPLELLQVDGLLPSFVTDGH